ncbi:hypothetical protein EVA_22713 [gut metagenome]|uniref:Uncharacterized protein n=1 Tax=gut metagenome TaxID=749906 RepID=J9F3T5_9ZZZZ
MIIPTECRKLRLCAALFLKGMPRPGCSITRLAYP